VTLVEERIGDLSGGVVVGALSRDGQTERIFESKGIADKFLSSLNSDTREDKDHGS
jgi:hypothetical protein